MVHAFFLLVFVFFESSSPCGPQFWAFASIRHVLVFSFARFSRSRFQATVPRVLVSGFLLRIEPLVHSCAGKSSTASGGDCRRINMKEAGVWLSHLDLAARSYPSCLLTRASGVGCCYARNTTHKPTPIPHNMRVVRDGVWCKQEVGCRLV